MSDLIDHATKQLRCPTAIYLKTLHNGLEWFRYYNLAHQAILARGWRFAPIPYDGFGSAEHLERFGIGWDYDTNLLGWETWGYTGPLLPQPHDLDYRNVKEPLLEANDEGYEHEAMWGWWERYIVEESEAFHQKPLYPASLAARITLPLRQHQIAEGLDLVLFPRTQGRGRPIGEQH